MFRFIKQLLCGHDMSPNLWATYTKHHTKKRHFYMCAKCGKRKYVD